MELPSGDVIFGRVLDATGHELDGTGPIKFKKTVILNLPAKRIIQFFNQDMFVTEDLSGKKCQYFTRE